MVNDVKVEIFESSVNCDRYHLLKPHGNIPNPNNQNSTVEYTESGSAFNGFGNGFILNTNYENIKDSRILASSITGINNGNRVFYLINSVQPIRNNKSFVTVEYDAWLNNRSTVSIGKLNTLFQCSRYLTSYPASDVVKRFYKYNKVSDLITSSYWNIIIFYHNSGSEQQTPNENVDYVYMIRTPKSSNFFPMYSQELLNFIELANLDTHNIVSIYLSPFDLDYTNGTYSNWVSVYNEHGLDIHYMVYNAFILENMVKEFTTSINVVADPRQKTVITDSLGAVVWTANRDMVGTKTVSMFLDISYGFCQFCGCVGSDTIENRFTIQCIDLGFVLDYYQQYQNIQKSYNASIRQAQLDKQLIDGVGDVVASTLWHGTSSANPNSTTSLGLGATSPMAMAGGAIGGAIQVGMQYISTSEYNKKATRAESRQARVQYDTISSNTMTFGRFVKGQTKPGVYTMVMDAQSTYAEYHDTLNYYNSLDYNCHIYKDDLESLILNTDNPPIFISGDFDFCNIGEPYGIQLNSRFKHGIEFVDWV